MEIFSGLKSQLVRCNLLCFDTCETPRIYQDLSRYKDFSVCYVCHKVAMGELYKSCALTQIMKTKLTVYPGAEIFEKCYLCFSKNLVMISLFSKCLFFDLNEQTLWIIIFFRHLTEQIIEKTPEMYDVQLYGKIICKLGKKNQNGIRLLC